MTEKYPDICHLVLTLLTRPVPTDPAPFPANASAPNQNLLDLLKARNITSFIMDAEVVAVDKDTGAYRTFQDLSNRAKKDVQVEDIKVVVGVFAFDLMLINDQASSGPRYILASWQIHLRRFRLSLATHSHSGDTCCGHYSFPIRPRTQEKPASITSSPSTRRRVPTSRPRCRRSSRWWWSRNVRG